MAKLVDRDGTWRFVGNPITKECVRPYLGRSIDPDGSLGLDPDGVYKVYRPWSELCKPSALMTFNGKALRNEHEMIGTAEGITPTDDTRVGGSLYNARPADDGSHVIVADITIFSGEIQELIASGKKELSLGYFCDYRKESGEFEGEHYDFVQCEIEGNHIALVERGRMGHDIRVFDKAITFDSMEITDMAKKAKDTAKCVADEVAELLKGASDEVLEKVKELLKPDETKDEDETKKSEDKDDNKSEDEDKDKSEAKDEDKGEDEDEDEDKDKDKSKDKDKTDSEDEDEDKKSEDEDEEKKSESKDEDEDEKKKKSGEDAFDAAIAEVTKRDDLYKRVVNYTGEFDCSKMTAKKVALYACDKLDIDATEDDAVQVLNAYLKGKGESFRCGMDASMGMDAPSSALKEWLKS